MNNAGESQGPLTPYLQKSKKDKRPIKLNEEAQAAFVKCKNDLAETTLIVHLAPEVTLRVISNAFRPLHGRSLDQKQGNHQKPLGFFSEKFPKTEKGCSV